MRFNGRKLPKHPEDLVQWFLIVQPALMKQAGMKIKGIKIMKIKGMKNLTSTPVGNWDQRRP